MIALDNRNIKWKKGYCCFYGESMLKCPPERVVGTQGGESGNSEKVSAVQLCLLLEGFSILRGEAILLVCISSRPHTVIISITKMNKGMSHLVV